MKSIPWRVWVGNNIIKRFRRIGMFGLLRFKITRLGYKLFWKCSPRNGEWDFALQWLSTLEKHWQISPTVLDVGTTDSLLIYELLNRGYDVLGIDQRAYQENNPHTKVIDIINIDRNELERSIGKFDYILAVSTIEHIGLSAYGEFYLSENGDKMAMEQLHYILKDNGYFLITVPNKHFGTDTGRGYSYQDFEKLIDGFFRIVHYEERSNQVCAVLVKLA